MIEHSPLLKKIFENVQKTPEKVALIFGEKEYTYDYLWSSILRFATYWNDKGFKKGDVIRLSAVKELSFICADFACQLLGITSELFDPELNEETESYDFDEILSLEKFEGEINGLSEHDVIEILHTTGTTSAPKGVCLTHFNVYWAAKNTSDYVQNDVNDIEVVGMPICHAFGIRRLHITLMNGATAIILQNFANVQLFIRTVEKYKVTSWGMAPTAWAYIRKISGKRINRFSSQIRHIEFGTAPMTLAEKKEILELLPDTRICHNYGLTESNRSAMIEYHDTEHLDSIGKPTADNVIIKVIDGEICVHGNQTMKGYTTEENNNDAFVDGFFRTGDCGYISDEGYIYLTGRMKEMINVGGKKVSPMEVEEIICSLGVGDCICAGFPHELLGECIKAFVLKGSTTMTLEEIDSRMKETAPFFKCPTYYEWIDVIPVNSMGKKQRRALK